MATKTVEPTNADSIPDGTEQPTVESVIEQPSSVTISVEPGTEPATGTSTDNDRGTGTRRRGRPPKFSVDNSETEPKETKTRRKTKQQQIGEENAAEITEFLLSVLEMSSSTVLGGYDTSLNVPEKSIIKPSMTKMLAKMSPANLETTNSIIQPLLLGSGLIMWYTRINHEMKQAKKEQEPFTSIPQNENIESNLVNDLENSWNGR